MNRGEIYLTIKDFMLLMGTEHYANARKRHKAIRDSIHPDKKSLTIREYCLHTYDDYHSVYWFLRGKAPPDTD